MSHTLPLIGLLVLTTLTGGCHGAAGSPAQSCPQDAAQPLPALGNWTDTLLPGCQQKLLVPASLLQGTVCADTSADGAQVAVELWDLNQVLISSGQGSAAASARADPVLLLAKGVQPGATYSASADWQFTPALNCYQDAAGYRLLRPYRKVLGPAQAPSGRAGNADWYITLLNANVYTSQPLDYLLRVSCWAGPQCASPMLNQTQAPGGSAQFDVLPECSAKGTCQTVCGSSSSGCPHCDCQPGWGDVGCNVPMQPLQPGAAVVSSSLQAGSWDYYQVTVPARAGALVVEMRRTRGDPVLFVKPWGAGFQAGGLPSVLDFQQYADQDSFRARLDTHQRTLTRAPPGLYYVGVFNNDMYIKEAANYSVQMRWANATDSQAVCPFDCFGNGACTTPANSTSLVPSCKCFQGFGGLLCEGSQASVALWEMVSGTLAPGQWAYYGLRLVEGDRAWAGAGLTVDFTSDGGQAVLLAALDRYPSLLNNDFNFQSKQRVQGPQTFSVRAADLAAGQLWVAVFNMDYYAHQPFSYALAVSPGAGAAHVPPYLFIVLAVTASLFLCLALSLCKRHVSRHGFPWAPHPPPAAPAMAVPVRPRGLPRELVEAFPAFEYKPPPPDAEAPPVPVVGEQDHDSEGTPQCSVCLGEYEAGEQIRRLPPCGHEFHLKCIDLWLTQHTTCPNCRASLLPEDPDNPYPPSPTMLMLGAREPSQASAPPASSAPSASEPAAAAGRGGRLRMMGGGAAVVPLDESVDGSQASDNELSRPLRIQHSLSIGGSGPL